MLERLLGHFLSRSIDEHLDRWVANGQQPDATRTRDGSGWELRFGMRHRMRCFGMSVGFLLPCILCGWLELTGNPLPLWCRLAYVFLILPIFILCVTCTVTAYTTRVQLSDAGVALRAWGRPRSELPWTEIISVERSHLFNSIVLKGQFGQKVCVSRELNGMGRMRDYVSRYVGCPVSPMALAGLPHLADAES